MTDTDTQGTAPAGRCSDADFVKNQTFIYFKSGSRRFYVKSFISAVTSPARALSEDGGRCEGGSRAGPARGRGPGNVRAFKEWRAAGAGKHRSCGETNAVIPGGKSPGIPGKTTRLEGLSGQGELPNGRLVLGVRCGRWEGAGRAKGE